MSAQLDQLLAERYGPPSWWRPVDNSDTPTAELMRREAFDRQGASDE